VSGTTYGEENIGPHILDDNGNITNDNKREMVYDAFNRLREVVRISDDETVASYTYGTMNRRFRKVVTNGGISGIAINETVEFFYSNWQVIEERDGTGVVTQQYVYGRYIDEPLTRDDRSGGQTVSDLNDGSGSDRLFYYCNTQYSTFALTDETGTIVEAYQYDAYGRQTVITGNGDDGEWFTDDDSLTVAAESDVENPYMFQGRRFDVESGMYYYRNRYYNSRLGRFISRDPMGVWVDLMSYGNGFAAFANNPCLREDPYGDQAGGAAGYARYKLRKQEEKSINWRRKSRKSYNSVNAFIMNNELKICGWLIAHPDCDLETDTCGICDLPLMGETFVSWRPWMHSLGVYATTIPFTDKTIINYQTVKDLSVHDLASLYAHEWVHQVCGIETSDYVSQIASEFQDDFWKEIASEVTN